MFQLIRCSGRLSRESSFLTDVHLLAESPAFLFMVSFAICSNINVCVFKINQIQQRQDMTGNTDRHVNIQSIIISIASLRFETDHCV